MIYGVLPLAPYTIHRLTTTWCSFRFKGEGYSGSSSKGSARLAQVAWSAKPRRSNCR